MPLLDYHRTTVDGGDQYRTQTDSPAEAGPLTQSLKASPKAPPGWPHPDASIAYIVQSRTRPSQYEHTVPSCHALQEGHTHTVRGTSSVGQSRHTHTQVTSQPTKTPTTHNLAHPVRRVATVPRTGT